jgi:DNA-binding PadR family transcriptional regulator
MLLGTKKTLYDHIVEALLANEASVSDIETYLEGKNTKVTIQGIYKTLRELIAEDIVVKQKKIYSINNVWREKAGELFVKRQAFSLSAGEEVVYRFTKLLHLDAFWKHTLSDLQKETGSFPNFDCVPHQFWFYAEGRKQSELEYYKTYETTETYLFSTIGGTTPMDKRMKEIEQTNFHQVHLEENTPFGRRDHITIMGPYIIRTKVSAKLSYGTDDIYNRVVDEKTLEIELNKLFKDSGIIKLSVEHNEKKARILRKRLAANFYIPKEIQQKYDLF